MQVYKTHSLGMLRAPAYPRISMPPWPDLSAATPANVTEWTGWLLKVIDIDEVADAIGVAAPGFTSKLRRLCAAGEPDPRDTRRAVLTMIRYMQRLKGRCTPAGLFAGVAPVHFAGVPSVCWGEDHHAVARPGAEWLAEVIRLLDGCPPVLARLPVVANTMLMIRGDRIIVPCQATGAGPAPSVADVSIRDSAPVRKALRAASARQPARRTRGRISIPPRLRACQHRHRPHQQPLKAGSAGIWQALDVVHMVLKPAEGVTRASNWRART